MRFMEGLASSALFCFAPGWFAPLCQDPDVFYGGLVWSGVGATNAMRQCAGIALIACI
jgi:hypothetical protein